MKQSRKHWPTVPTTPKYHQYDKETNVPSNIFKKQNAFYLRKIHLNARQVIENTQLIKGIVLKKPEDKKPNWPFGTIGYFFNTNMKRPFRFWSGKNKKRLLCVKQLVSELSAGPQLFKYFIANRFSQASLGPFPEARVCPSGLALLSELAGGLGFSRLLWNCHRSSTCVRGWCLAPSGFCFIPPSSFWENQLPFPLRASCWWAGCWKTHCILGLFHCVPEMLYQAQWRPQMLFTCSDSPFN